MDLINKTYATVNISDEWPIARQFPTLSSVVSRLLPTALIIGGIVFFVTVIVAGFAVLSGAGSEDAQTKAKWHQILTYGAIGLVIMFTAFWVLQIINFITGNSMGNLFGKIN